ncbi:MAG: 1-acyl-sn-glycerol-3-phosphate acyltransferase [Flavobacteriales bacterium]|jgi:putative hemolysin
MNELRVDVETLLKEKNPSLHQKMPRFAIRYLERIIHQKKINAFLQEYGHLKNQAFCQAVIDFLNIRIAFHGMERIPKTGPVILVFNHPLGGVDGVAFIAAMKDYRIDLSFLVNDILLHITPISELFVGTNKHGTNKGDNRAKIREMFFSDQAVCIFPAGMVSRKQGRVIKDLEWKRTFVSYARETGHPILPIHIEGRLSRFFYGLHRFRTMVGIKSTLEMLYLADELYKQRGKTITFRVGTPIHVSEHYSGKNDLETAQAIKEVLYQIPNKHGEHNS